ncbi:unnamed protein product, partial [Ectocarpus sp. 12 AP-2014]
MLFWGSLRGSPGSSSEKHVSYGAVEVRDLSGRVLTSLFWTGNRNQGTRNYCLIGQPRNITSLETRNAIHVPCLRYIVTPHNITSSILLANRPRERGTRALRWQLREVCDHSRAC